MRIQVFIHHAKTVHHLEMEFDHKTENFYTLEARWNTFLGKVWQLILDIL